MATTETIEIEETTTAAKDWTTRVRKGLESLRPTESRKRAAKAAKAGVEFQKKTVISTLDGIERLQAKAEDRIKKMAHDSSYLPDEGKTVVDEWIALAKKSRKEFKKSTDKSYDLVLKYIDRVEEKDEATE